MLVAVGLGALFVAGYASPSGLLGSSYSYGYQYCTTPGQYQYCSTSTSTTSTTTPTTTSTSTTTTTTPTTTSTSTTTTTTSTTTTPKNGCGADTLRNRCEIAINDVSKKEGNAGTTAFVFTVTIVEGTPVAPVSVKYKTENVTATAPSDYTATSGTLVFPAGVRTQTITVLVNGDTLREGNETFFVTLTNPSPNAVFEDYRGVGTIVNDD